MFVAAVAVCSIWNIFATGNEGVNPPQSGVITPATGTTSITNTFAFPFQTVPVMVVYSALTNGTPITNSITTTNFTLSWPVAGSTNASFAWQAYVGGTRMQSGTNTLVANTLLTNTFAYAYAVPPVVVVSGNNTNTTAVVAVISVSTTGFVEESVTSQAGSWISLGTVYNPPSENVGANPPSNKVIY